MKFAHLRIALPAAALLGVAVTPALAQRPPSPQQQMIALQQQLAASQASAFRLEQRLDAIERQLQQIVAASEQNGHRLNMLEQGVQQIRRDQDARIAALERAVAAAAAQPQPQAQLEQVTATEPPQPRDSKIQTTIRPAEPATSVAAGEGDPGEDAYSEGFRLWNDGKYDQAITALRAFTAAYPKHRRVSWANNLVGRALLDKGQPRPAAEAFLANYRSNPKGGRAQDSLYYLGQALMKLGQPNQACKAYAELTSVYGASVRADLKPMISKAREEANCS